MMKNALVSMVLGIILCALVFSLSGCAGYAAKAVDGAANLTAAVLTLGSEPGANAQPGETEAEGRRRHMRNARINQQLLMRDIETVFLYDRPSRLSDRRIP